MELSGLIFVALALTWAVVLIPMALRHHDEVARTRAVDKFSDDMRVLARREAVTDREARLVVEQRRTAVGAGRPVATSSPGPASATSERRVETTVRSRRRAAAAAARRRRRILAVLLLGTVVVGVGVPIGWFLPWAPAVPAGVTVLYLVVARISVRREQRRRPATRRTVRNDAPAKPAQPSGVDSAEPVAPPTEAPIASAPVAERAPAADHVARAVSRNEQGLEVVSGLDDTSSFPVGLLRDVEPTTDAGALWDPLPVTLPTYITKPRATRSVRTIDLQEAGVASSGRDAADSALVAEAATSGGEPEQARRAVGS